jgi:tetratricopeptide (TPR) repeat protein
MDARELMQARTYRAVVAALPAPASDADRLLLADALEALGCLRRATGVLREALMEDRGSGAVWARLGYLQARRQQPELALKLLRRALERADDALRPRVLGHIAGEYAARDRFRTAREWLARAAEAAHDDEARAAQLAQAAYVHVLAAEFGPALDFARQSLALAPERPVSHFQLAHALLRSGGPEAALASIRRAAALDPQRLTYRWSLADCLMTLERWDEAAAELRTALEHTPESDAAGRLRCDLGDCLYETGCRGEALAVYRHAAREEGSSRARWYAE